MSNYKIKELKDEINDMELTIAELEENLVDNFTTCNNPQNTIKLLNKVIELARLALLPLYEEKALIYAEKGGVIDYKVANGTMIYYTNYPIARETYKVIVDLSHDKNNEIRQLMTKYYKKGNVNMNC